MGIDMRNGCRSFSMGSLDKPVKEDYWPSDHQASITPFLGKAKPILGVSYDSKTYPDQFSWKWATGDALNQQELGICFICTACNLAKTVVWAHTGLKLSIDKLTAAEIGELGGGDRHSGGTHSCGKALLTYTGSNQCVKKFQEVCSSIGVTKDNLLDGPKTSCTKEKAITVLNEYGPFYWSHNPTAYSNINGSHAILVIGYDSDYAYFKGSWSSDETDETYHHLGKVDWSNFQSKGNGIYGYNKKLLTTNL